MMELRHLTHFLAVAEERNFTRAAARIHVAQSALSVSVRTLERELGARLFDRSTHHVVLTDAGEALLVEARHTLAAAEAARDAVAEVSGGLRGTVRIGIMHSLVLIDLAALLTRYHRERPGVRIVPRAAGGGSVELAEGVAEGRLDLAFAALPGTHPTGVEVIRLATERLDLACPPGSPLEAGEGEVPLTEVDGERFVDLPAGWGTRMSADQLFLREGLRREVAVEAADPALTASLVRAGFGFAFLSPSLLSGVSGVTLRPVRPHPVFEVSLVLPERRLSAAARAFVDLTLGTYPS